ncbi:DeoR/GlpR family DNA-binding transcription regulator [Cytobacillus purgationiresistens]|uniref:DeoR/GlpR family transcriptional regulator of sugar metabolism n=1 Tax=Cytobacillus purgationiresistens TaxID=863449 RepID=A0ABU0AKR6_9BACI|nr:DeoR/GlpR family DNA-binding transcription regulator [Cytobacillus purgationiresistens]MDQ0271372.1 DeoR/GlpR family transcriptional regulator of sugar metabolism [Cytobacillus purgationiresistens]
MSVLAEERKKRIVELVDHQGQVKVNELAKDFNVSTETIRRHLEELEGEKKIKKVYGGAVRIDTMPNELSMFEREILNIDKKRIIGKKAALIIEKGDVIFIDEGSTTLQMASSLKNIEGLTVITNSFPLVVKLMGYEEQKGFMGEIIFLGGNVRSNHFRTSGSLAERMAKEFFVDKAFVAIDGIDPDAGITSYDLDKCMLSKIFISNSKQSYILSDSTKIGVRANYKIETLSEIDFIISDVRKPEVMPIADYKWIQG